jgi:hypothetical protein
VLTFAIDAFYKGIDNVIIHAVEHDMVRTQDIIFDYLTTGNELPRSKLRDSHDGKERSKLRGI